MKLRQQREWLRALPQRRRLRIGVLMVLGAVLLPFLPAWLLVGGAEIPLLALYELVVQAVLFWAVFLPLFRRVYAIVQATNMLPPYGKEGSVQETLREVEAYIRASEERQDRVQLLQKQAELDALQSQINPHFLYNTLDTIRGQALEEGCQIAPDMIEALSTLLRYTISHRGDMVTLRQELRSIDNYMKIQQFRFSNRFSYETRIEEDAGDILSLKLPKLTLQPLIENAIFHGIESLPSGGKIEVELFTTQSRLVIGVRDNGVGMDEEQLSGLRQRLAASSFAPPADASPRRGSGLAVTNVNARIQLAFGPKFGVQVFSTKGIGTQFQVSLPILEEP